MSLFEGRILRSRRKLGSARPTRLARRESSKRGEAEGVCSQRFLGGLVCEVLWKRAEHAGNRMLAAYACNGNAAGTASGFVF